MKRYPLRMERFHLLNPASFFASRQLNVGDSIRYSPLVSLLTKCSLNAKSRTLDVQVISRACQDCNGLSWVEETEPHY
ncbi:hypothetical protein SADUNF_Sadunf06G0082200 [Salix dunnii]|uniref:Uncharacterized protein n=1 Tax=Salix dunnii TaxID=1413687 RepID=A0A835K1J0_9ROSI|nr:hypothetical protein SADUNF_Sadunf06G0082200 [Salix dunnii]